MTTKAMTLRLPADKAAELEAVARVDNVPVAEAIRAAIDDRIAQRRQDKDFQARLRAIVEEDRGSSIDSPPDLTRCSPKLLAG